MKSINIAAVVGLGLLAASATPVFAASSMHGYATANVNERSGPSTDYPPIVVIPAGSPVVIYGCLSDDSWCDISWNGNRGWMASGYLQANYNNQRVVLHDYIGDLGVPFVTFDLGNYWGDHYRGKSFYGQRSQWRNFHPAAGGGQFNNPPPGGSPPGNNPGDHHWSKFKTRTLTTQATGGTGQNSNGQNGNSNYHGPKYKPAGTGVTGQNPNGGGSGKGKSGFCVSHPGDARCR
jgi:uncharacterized protein YraI